MSPISLTNNGEKQLNKEEEIINKTPKTLFGTFIMVKLVFSKVLVLLI
jgi:hypothetical protein